jgi:two-component system NtrC family sensor kinase
MQRFWSTLFSGRLRTVLMVSFCLIAAITIGIGAVATSKTITDYLARAADQRVARDMDLALAFYRTREQRIARVAQRLAATCAMRNAVGEQGSSESGLIDAAVDNEIHAEPPIRNQLIMVLDREGNVLSGRLVAKEATANLQHRSTTWTTLPIVAAALEQDQPLVATEVVPAQYLASVGLAEQAQVDIVDTPKAAPELYDAREGTAGLTLLAAAPVHDPNGHVVGVVVAMHLFNNDFSLVDQIKQVAGVDTATIFFGGLRVSTNVLNEQGERAIGTRISQEVGDQVLLQGLEYPGRAYVVKEWFITRYIPLHNYRGGVVGSLYVGARESTFQALVQAFVARVIYIALGAVALAAVLSFPVSIAIARPIGELVEAHRQLASGKMGVRVVPPPGQGELAALAKSFNVMAQTLQVTQEQLVQKEKLASVGQLAAGVAHEINNPLGTIMLLSDVLCKETPEEDPRREDLEMITAQAKRCKGIVFDLLSFARQNRVMAQRTDVNQLVQRIVAEEAPKDRYTNIRIIEDLSPRLPVIQADPEQLRQALTNLMTNAADAMAPQGGGVMTISTRHAGLQHVELAVADTGEGMSEEVRSQLFTPFFTTKPPGKGTGLGLSIIYGIVKMHRGDIQVWSQQGEGTRFTIRLPTRLPDLNIVSTAQGIGQGD